MEAEFDRKKEQGYRVLNEGLTLDEYQLIARETAIYPEEHKVMYPTLGLTGEAGEVADKVKKVIRDNEGQFSAEQRKEIAKELGDVLWYLASVAEDLGYELSLIASMNIEKLSSRKERGALHGSGDKR